MEAKYEIVFTKKADRQIKKLDPDIEKQIRNAINGLTSNPRPQSSKRLKGEYKGLWRMRSGNYRIIYEIKEQKLLITVIRVGHRKNIYYQQPVYYVVRK
jgi:mRNA interferase RelE/StbE